MPKFNDTTIYGNLTVTGTISGSINGNAATATALATSRTIFGQSFDGTGNVTGDIIFWYSS